MEKQTFDIVILGGGLSASLLTISILRKHPELKVLILEKDAEFRQKVGESTSDITALFLRRFDIDEILCRQVKKTGLRFFFNEENGPDRMDVAEFSSPTYDGPNNSFQINRKTFDEDLLQEAISLGATVYRPAILEESRFDDFSCQLKVKYKDQLLDIEGKWFVDASGRSRYIHHKLGWKDVDPILDTTAIFAHFEGIPPQEEWNMVINDYWEEHAIGDGSYATLHFMQKKAWWWLIKIDDQKTSIGYVFESDKHDIKDPEKFFDEMLAEEAQLSSIIAGAKRTKTTLIKDVPYQSEKLYDKGIVLMGDSGAFVDPMVSPGIEMICQQVLWMAELIPEHLTTGKFNERKWKKYDRLFSRAFRHRMEIYKYGYKYMHSYDLSSNWLQLALLAYFGLFVFSAFIFPKRLKRPFTISWLGRLGFIYITWRMNRISRRRERQGRHSKPGPNAVTYSSFYYPTGIWFYTIPLRMFFKWLVRYLRLELKELRYLFK